MNKAKIIAELENMVVARLFGRQPWLADRETYSAVKRKLIEWDVVTILEDYRLIDASDADVIYARMSNDNAESVLTGYVKRAYFDYRKATKFLH